MANTNTSQSDNGSGIFNKYALRPKDLSGYSAYRGVTDFTQIGQFNQFETGYSFLEVIEMPKFITALGKSKTCGSKIIQTMADSFKHMLEFEFRGLDGLPDVTADTYEITDGINTQRLINKVTQDTAITVSSNYFEKSGGLITKFSEYYLTGIHDRISNAKTYHGLIRNGEMEPGPENEVFTMMYFATDSSMLRLERAFLLCNAQLTKAETSMYNSQKGEYGNKEMTIEFNCFPVTGELVDKIAYFMLQKITACKKRIKNNDNYLVEEIGIETLDSESRSHVAALDSNNYQYGIISNKSDVNSVAIPILHQYANVTGDKLPN